MTTRIHEILKKYPSEPFEHRALDAPAGFVPSAEIELVEEAKPETPGSAGDRALMTPRSREVRVAFDVDVQSETSSLVQAIEEGGEGGEGAAVAPVDGTSRKGLLAAGLFLVALALGFLVVWLLG